MRKHINHSSGGGLLKVLINWHRVLVHPVEQNFGCRVTRRESMRGDHQQAAGIHQKKQKS